MTNEPANYPDDPATDEQLVAYLDGELDPESTRDLEERLGKDEAVRQKLHQLERAWDALNALPETDVSPQFAHTTLEMIAQRAEKDQHGMTSRWFTPRVRRVLAGTAALAVAFALGLFVSTNHGRGENEQVVNELPILDELDAFRRAGDIEYLRMIRAAELFPVEESHEG